MSGFQHGDVPVFQQQAFAAIRSLFEDTCEVTSMIVIAHCYVNWNGFEQRKSVSQNAVLFLSTDMDAIAVKNQAGWCLRQRIDLSGSTSKVVCDNNRPLVHGSLVPAVVSCDGTRREQVCIRQQRPGVGVLLRVAAIESGLCEACEGCGGTGQKLTARDWQEMCWHWRGSLQAALAFDDVRSFLLPGKAYHTDCAGREHVQL